MSSIKNRYEPAQRKGINVFEYAGEKVKIVYPGGFLTEIVSGEIVMFWRPHADDKSKGMVWCGRTWPDYYAFELNKPVPVTEAMELLFSNYQMRRAHLDSDFVSQEELPF